MKSSGIPENVTALLEIDCVFGGCFRVELTGGPPKVVLQTQRGNLGFKSPHYLYLSESRAEESVSHPKTLLPAAVFVCIDGEIYRHNMHRFH